MNLRKGMIRYSSDEEAVSEIMSTLLLVTMAVVMFSAIVVMVLNPWINYSDDSPPLVSILGSVQGDQVILVHQGGVDLDGRTRITITIANVDHSFVLGGSTFFTDSNGDGKWNVGEMVIYPGTNLKNTKVKCTVIDVEKNTIIMDKTIQQGNTVLFPYVSILDPISVNQTSATLNMYYDFINQNYFNSGYLNFTYGPNGGPYQSTPAVKPFMMQGWYSYTVLGLNEGTLYECWAYLRYTGSTNTSGPLFFYTFQDARGIWHLDENPGDTIAHDAVTPYRDGNVVAATFTSAGAINNSLHFEGASQYVTVPHHPKFNITGDITIKTWLNLTKTGLGFPGNITDVDDAMYLSGNISTECTEPAMIHVESGTNDNIYAVVYHDNSSAYVTTMQINTNGQIQNIIQTLSLSVAHFLEPDIVHVGGDVYAIAFGASESQVEKKGHLMTVRIDDGGNITQLNTFDFDTYYGREPRLLHVSGDIYAVTFGGCEISHTNQTGKLFTISIDGAGTIGNDTIAELKFPENYCSEAEIVQVTNDIFAITYNGIDEKQGYIRTVQILPSGVIAGGTFIDSFQFGLPTDWLEPSIIHVSGDVFAISYGADSNNLNRNGFLQTVSIRSNGTIQHSILSSLAFPTPYSSETKIALVGNNIYAIAYSGGDSSKVERGFLVTVDIDAAGNISGAVDDVYEFLGYKGLEPDMITLFSNPNQFVIIYGAGSLSAPGFMITVSVDQVGSPQWVIQKGDVFGVRVNGNRVVASMTIGGISRIVSGTAPLSWNHVVLSYTAGMLTLKINGVVSQDGSCSCSGTIKTNLDPLIFGDGFYGSLDEIEIYSIYKP